MSNGVESLGMGDHVAYFFKTNAERLSFVIPYMVNGLRLGERCLYIADENSVPGIYRELEKARIDVDGAQKSGALAVLTKRETYLRHGLFEPEKMIADLNSEVRFSLEHGFTGFRASGEMSWALDLPSSTARLIEYEEKLQAVWPREFGGVCQYDETRFPADLIARMKSIHQIYVQGNKVVRQPAHIDFCAQKINAIAELRQRETVIK